MKYVLFADYHARGTSPYERMDNYPDTLYRKLEFIAKVADDKDATLVCAGDLFHTIKTGARVFNNIVHILQKLKYTPLVIKGQHDLENHGKDLMSCPIYGLIESGIVKDIGGSIEGGICGIGWNDKEPVIEKNNKCKILAIHKLVTRDAPPPYLRNAISARSLLRKYPQFKYIVTGDNHSPFVYEKNERYVLNCGSVGRANKDQKKHKPRIYFIDLKKDIFEIIHIPIQPAKVVFRKKNADIISSVMDGNIQKIREIIQDSNMSPQFENIVNMIIKKESISKEVSAICREICRSIDI